MIRIKGLKVALAGREILRGVDLAGAAGETVALMGASGSGKSTLLRVTAGLLKPDAGEVWLNGVLLGNLSGSRLRELRSKVGMLFQGNALFDSMTVAENIGFVLKEVLDAPLAAIKPKVDELLARLRLGPVGEKRPAELSGGMKKRVGIARAVAHAPRIVFYDDPTAGLDPITSVVIAQLIAELGRDPGRASIVVSNHLPVVAGVAQRVALLHEGKIMELGTPRELVQSERSEVREFLEYVK
jgi:phospholipid/cholesterol/gamma-HCH transport system ATP-binding protein